ncbi:MAG TPA: hypothetical protein VHC97_05475 [Thermoanaerobaculia bacterium]|nr:hypothetical protein [Thermoanaerobaculia bacterium]
MRKRPFDVDQTFARIEEAVRLFPKKLPRCSTCPVLDMCLQVGVTKHR